jgi:hypothetical protein
VERKKSRIRRVKIRSKPQSNPLHIFNNFQVGGS